ncbi:lysozyme-like, partial [Zootermopsis nevadensis]|uniref:lysozyme-like n=1 Tax=Zootermopsis nevadensis TaxID=136037 RepID=UPI000B8EA66D
FLTVHVSTGVCLIISESSGNTATIGGPNENGSYDYSLFQVSLTSEQFQLCIHRFEAWNGWKNKFKGKILPDVTPC